MPSLRQPRRRQNRDGPGDQDIFPLYGEIEANIRRTGALSDTIRRMIDRRRNEIDPEDIERIMRLISLSTAINLIIRTVNILNQKNASDLNRMNRQFEPIMQVQIDQIDNRLNRVNRINEWLNSAIQQFSN